MARIYRLLGADRRFYTSDVPGRLGGNARLSIYGRLDCRCALRALAAGDAYRRHRVFFADEASAVAAGYRPCAVCMRARYLLWRAARPPSADRSPSPHPRRSSPQKVRPEPRAPLPGSDQSATEKGPHP